MCFFEEVLREAFFNSQLLKITLIWDFYFTCLGIPVIKSLKISVLKFLFSLLYWLFVLTLLKLSPVQVCCWATIYNRKEFAFLYYYAIELQFQFMLCVQFLLFWRIRDFLYFKSFLQSFRFFKLYCWWGLNLRF